MSTQPTNSPKAKIHWLSVLGPGIITAALVFGPSKMTITSKMGADYGYDLLWVIILAIFFMMVFTTMAARIGAQNRESLLTLIRNKFGKPVAIFIGLGIFLVAISFQSGNSTGVAISVGEATGSNPKIWIVVFNVVGILLLFFRSFYKVLEKLMLVLIIIMLFSFLTTAILVQPNLIDMSKGIIPSIPDGSMVLIIAFIASCFSLVGAFYQSYLVQERKKMVTSDQQNGTEMLGSRVGIIILGIMSTGVLVCAANILHPQGIKVNSATEMGKALEPLFGDYASQLFYIGLFGASFSSLIGNAVLGGSLLGDTFGYGNNLNNKMVKLFISIVMIFGSVIALVFGKLPLELIVFAQSITTLLVPFIGFTLYLIGNDKTLMKERVNSTSTKIWGALGLILIIGLAISNLITLIK
ncbi:Nramp family divalent metal transporter [Sphingobacterium spiritivorum]|uniref:Nramp family divalent metal transporter n=1 Tax=Sphingobacterium spiritivorum TaxID=258 RepID=UPI00191904FA|nr:Nramp family divalent metal transporter [Sphingobacterium spiritivorum]QQT26186.1 Nramp family divalent metal transporter [Sphingobacterium spiritivorum]